MLAPLRKIAGWIARHWGLPSNFQWWWVLLGLPSLPALVGGAISFLRDAPLWQTILVVVGVYVVALVLAGFILPRWLPTKYVVHPEAAARPGASTASVRDEAIVRANQLAQQVQGETDEVQSQPTSPEVSRQKRLCFHLAHDLRGLYREFQDGERMLIAHLQEQEEANMPEKEREEERRTKQLDLENKTRHKYHYGYSDRLERLYEELETGGWLGPNDEILFLNLRDPNDIRKVADRLDEVGRNLL